jgi:hypothetical protein
MPEWRSCTVIIHQHLDGTSSIRYGPHVLGRFDGQQQPIDAALKERAA